MSTYIRFQTSVHCPHTKRPLGVFRATGVLEGEGRIEEHFRDTVNETLRWYNDKLTVPRIPYKKRRSVFWFRSDQQEIVDRMWDLVAILVEHQIEVRRIRTTDPGIIVYRDDYQVAAMPSQRINRALRV